MEIGTLWDWKLRLNVAWWGWEIKGSELDCIILFGHQMGLGPKSAIIDLSIIDDLIFFQIV